jgi:uncharacterized protein
MHNDLTSDRCEEILAANHYAHLGCSDDGQPYVVPVTYTYRDNYIYGVTQEGLKVDIMRKNPRVCVQIEQVENDKWESVVCQGIFEEITDGEEVQNVKLLLAEDYGSSLLKKGKGHVSPMVENLHKQQSHIQDATVVYRIKANHLTGKAGAM